MDMPLISIIIPAYNVEGFLKECLDSIVKQSFDDYEVILVDDGSTDSSPIICDQYAERYSNVHVIHKENGGVSSARNVALDIAVGQWIWFVDADDYISSDSFDLLYKTIKSHDCDTVFSGLIRVYEDGRIEESHHNDDYISSKENFLLHNYSFQNGMILFSNIIIQENSLRFVGGIKMGEDLEFQYRYLMLCERPIRINQNIYYYRQRGGSAIANVNSSINNMWNNINNAKSLLAFIIEKKVKSKNWIEQRIRLMLKASVQSAIYVSKLDRKGLQIELKKILSEYKQNGFAGIQDRTLSLASCNLQIYLMTLSIYLKVKGRY